ncbi:MAG: CHAT domain-containing protein, partial [Cyanobacteria bacterium J06635_10]
MKDWNEKYANYRKGKDDSQKEEINWRNNLPELLQELAKILDIPTIVSQITNNSIQNLKSKIQNLILVPHRDLHRFPLHALFPDNFTITYLPTAKIALNQSKLPKWNNTYNDSKVKFLSVEHPPSSGHTLLEFAEVESEVITQMFPNCTRISSQQATKNAVESALPNNYNIFHFTGHGEYNFHNPALSELKLAEKEKITLENICKFDLSSYQLVTLAACE